MIQYTQASYEFHNLEVLENTSSKLQFKCNLFWGDDVSHSLNIDEDFEPGEKDAIINQGADCMITAVKPTLDELKSNGWTGDLDFDLYDYDNPDVNDFIKVTHHYDDRDPHTLYLYIGSPEFYVDYGEVHWDFFPELSKHIDISLSNK